VISARTVPRDPARVEKRRPRWERIVREAAEQSQRGRLPVLERAMDFSTACAESVDRHDRVLLPWEEATEGSLGDAVRDAFPFLDRTSALEKVALIVGPEGGFTSQEADQARGLGIQVVTLGPRILRAETAGIVAAALVMEAVGELG
jgi:16S rRNA (uracil1498-N3)-methyltransferase